MRLESEEKVEIIREAMEELKALDINVLPVAEKTQMTDYMVVCSGTSNVHIRAITDRVVERLKEHDIKGIRREGYSEARWILMDFGDVVVHVFDPEDRKFYRLEEYWTRDKPMLAPDAEAEPVA
ncbi:MAG: ribosome silencing factor [Actinomycetota bacterium]